MPDMVVPQKEEEQKLEDEAIPYKRSSGKLLVANFEPPWYNDSPVLLVEEANEIVLDVRVGLVLIDLRAPDV